MKVVLLRDVRGIGRAHETVEASDGHALNYLIPQKLAVAATAAATLQAESRMKKAGERRELDHVLLEQNLASLAEARIVIRTKANEKGHLYDAVGASEISAAAKEQAHVDVPADVIKLDKPIKELGTFDVSVAAGTLFGKFSVTVEAE
jgi:large subunit ribosomal protein L9